MLRLQVIVLYSSALLALRVGRVNACGEPVSVSMVSFKCGDIKNVTSPNYPQNYADDEISRWNIEVDAGQRIIVMFTDFYTEDSDYLSIKENNYPSAEAKYSGSNVITPYVSLGNHLMITFRPDSSESTMGFHLSISCLKVIYNTYIHEAFEGLEHTRILTQSLCRDYWHSNVADTICREAGFPGSYETNFTSGIENVSVSDGIVYQCNKSTFRLQDCKRSTSKCNVAPESLVIKCNVFSELGCFNIARYTHLLTRSVQLSRDQCVTHCKNYSATPQYAVHHNGTRCSCINQTELNVTTLFQERERCMINVDTQTWHWATLFDASFGFCEEPPQLNNGSWTTSYGYMYGTTITAMCNTDRELVGGDQMLTCGKGMNSSSQDFEWHGTMPSCRERITDSSVDASFSGSDSSVDASFSGSDSSVDASFSGSGKILNSKWQRIIAFLLTFLIICSEIVL